MAKIKPIDVIKGISGKYNGKSSDYFSTNTSSSQIRLAKMSNPHKGPFTEKQMAQHANFKQRVSIVSAWLRANRPTEENPKGTALYQEAQKLKRDMGLSTVNQVVYRYMNTENRIVLPSEYQQVNQMAPGGMV